MPANSKTRLLFIIPSEKCNSEHIVPHMKNYGTAILENSRIVCELTMLSKLFSRQEYQILATICQLLWLCGISHQSCVSKENNAVHEGRYFAGTAINATTELTRAAAPHIFGCRHLCRTTANCVGLTFNASSPAIDAPCHLANGTRLDKLLVNDVNSATILFLEKQCSYSSIELTALNDAMIQQQSFGFLNISSRRVAVMFAGRWLRFQARIDGSVDFYRNWEDYKYGFGDVDGEFWLGNEHIHQLTQIGVFDLGINLQDGTTSRTPMYSNFSLAKEEDGYRLGFGAPLEGDIQIVGDSLAYHKNQRFSTYDNDWDAYWNCAQMLKGAWWFKRCFYSHLNGEYQTHRSQMQPRQGIIWKHWTGSTTSLSGSTMGIRFSL